MSTSYDAVIIGAGIIGASIAFELSKKGYRTLNVDKLGVAGAGSTINTCAVIRTHYSTIDGTAIAYESYLTGSSGRNISASRTSGVTPGFTTSAS